MGRADSTGGGFDTGGGQVLGVSHGQVMAAVVVVGNETGEVFGVAVPGPDAVGDGVDDELAGHGGGHRPAQDAAGVGVDDQRGVAPARPGPDVGEVDNPEPVRCQRGEVAVYQIAWLREPADRLSWCA